MGTATSPTTDNLGLRDASADAEASVSGTWQDSIGFVRKGVPEDGKPYTVHAKLALAGHWDINLGPPTGDPNDYDSGSAASFELKIDGTGVPTGPYFGYYAYSQLSSRPGEFNTNNPPPQSIPISMP
jgi:hypothetical protein